MDNINEKPDHTTKLLSFSCLFLDIKFLLFLRAFEYFGVYFAIIINVAKKVYIFLVIFITIMIMSFAHAFYILLSPTLDYSLDERTINDDPNNPWNLDQSPDANTNMFINYKTALFAMYLFLTGIIVFFRFFKF